MFTKSAHGPNLVDEEFEPQQISLNPDSNLLKTRDNMKKLTFAAAAALSLVSASTMAQSTVTLYGLIDAAVSVTTKQPGGSITRVEAGQLATSRWGIRGSEDLGGGMKAFFNLESTLINDDGRSGLGFGGGTAGGTTVSLFDRASLVGLSGDFGSVSVGRQNILGVDSIGLADPIGLSHPGSGNPNVAFSALNAGGLGIPPPQTPQTPLYANYGTNGGGAALRQNNSIRYLTPVFGNAFGGALMYGAGEQAGNASKNSYQGISGYYRSGNSGAALAYAKLKNAADSDTLTLWGGGVKYEINSMFTVKGTYAQNKQDLSNRKIAVVGLGVDYAVTPALTMTAAYYKTKSTGRVQTVDTQDGKAEQFYLIGKYALSKRTALYSTYTHAKAGSAAVTDTELAPTLTNPGNSKANRVAFGVVHSF